MSVFMCKHQHFSLFCSHVHFVLQLFSEHAGNVKVLHAYSYESYGWTAWSHRRCKYEISIKNDVYKTAAGDVVAHLKPQKFNILSDLYCTVPSLHAQ